MSETNKNWAIYGSGISMDSNFIKKLLKGEASEPFQYLKDKNGVLFSNYTLDQFIREEEIHDEYTLSQNSHRSIRSFSSGEQKKALFNHLLSKNPDFIILDNAFDMLDQESFTHFLSRLKELSEKMVIIQIFRRKDRILPFIKNVVRFQEGKILFSGTIAEYKHQFKNQNNLSVNGSIPRALVEFEPMSNPLIEFKNVSVSYGETKILNNICWKIKQGEFWHLTGPNGSGKTTLLTMVTGDNTKAYGQNLTLFGRKKGSGESIWDIKKKIGYVTPAMTVLFRGRHTVENMVISGLYDSIGLYKEPRSLEKKLAAKWIDFIGLTDLKLKWFSDISEEKQCMVLIARSMIKHPPVLILDEPTHGLGDYNVRVLTTLINKIAKESQTAIIFVAHKSEKGLNPEFTYELTPGERGSVGKVQKLE